MFSSCIQFDCIQFDFFYNRVIRINNKCKCGGYAPSNTFYKIEIELLVFKLCPVLFGLSFSNLSSGCSSEWKMNHLKLYYEALAPIAYKLISFVRLRLSLIAYKFKISCVRH